MRRDVHRLAPGKLQAVVVVQHAVVIDPDRETGRKLIRFLLLVVEAVVVLVVFGEPHVHLFGVGDGLAVGRFHPAGQNGRRLSRVQLELDLGFAPRFPPFGGGFKRPRPQKDEFRSEEGRWGHSHVDRGGGNNRRQARLQRVELVDSGEFLARIHFRAAGVRHWVPT